MDGWYLAFLNIALGSCGEFHSCCESFKIANQIKEDAFKELDALHYKTENELINLIRSLQRKQREGSWNQTL